MTAAIDAIRDNIGWILLIVAFVAAIALGDSKSMNNPEDWD